VLDRGERCFALQLVDGAPVVGRIIRAGERWWAVRCRLGDLEISVGAQDWHPDVIAVDTMDDVVAMLARLQRPATPGRGEAPAGGEVPEHLRGEPHRALVDVVLAATREEPEWLTAHAVPPDLPWYWGTVWRAAVRRHTELTDEPDAAADRSVRGMVDQLAGLHRDAAWFREERALRERAIGETLLHGTGMSDRVPSRPAQLAWRRLQDHGDRDPRAHHAAHEAWLAAWAGWAEGQ
jgi:hypothetical protein